MAGIVILALAIVYRYAPDRAQPRWQWISWGAAGATVAAEAKAAACSNPRGSLADRGRGAEGGKGARHYRGRLLLDVPARGGELLHRGGAQGWRRKGKRQFSRGISRCIRSTPGSQICSRR